MPERPRLPAPGAQAARPPLPLPALAAALQRALPQTGAPAPPALEGDRRRTLGASDDLRLLDTTPLPCGQSRETTRRSELAPWAGFGYCPAHCRRYWGFKLVLLSAADGTIVDFDLVAANSPEREAALTLLEANPIEGATIVCDKGFAGADFEAAVRELRALLLRPSRSDEPERPNPPIGWIRQRIEPIINTLKDQLLLEQHGGRTPAGLLTRVTARILALCACVNLNQRLGLTSRSLVLYAD